MPDGISFKISGVDEVQSGLRQINRKIARKVVQDSLRAGASEIAKAARAGAPKKTGRLRRAIRVRRSRRNTRPQQGRYGYFVSIYPGKTRDDPKGAYYGNIVDGGFVAKGKRLASRRANRAEFGRRSGRKTARGRTVVRGRRFMERAYRNRGAMAAKLAIRLMERGVDVAKREAGFS